ncbi:MAG: hypothetical protein KJO98_08020 [Rhodothermia bacterium]|nr:hypothetical protein [Rhodothermia bacterium]
MAVLGTDVPYSFFGVLSPQLDRQVLRLYSIDGVLEPISPTPIDADVTSVARSNLTTRVWRDSIITEPDGMFAHVFTAPFAAEFGETYEITATRSDGAATGVVVTVPAFSELVVPPKLEKPPAVLDVQVTGTPPNLIRVQVIYHYKFQSFTGTERDSTAIAYDGVGSQQPTSFLIPVQVSRDTAFIRSLVKDRFGVDTEIKVVLIRTKLIVANREWSPPGGIFDPEILVEPGTMSNVTGGFGFVGAGFSLAKSWAPNDTLLVKR